jgi:hypothetical protein
MVRPRISIGLAGVAGLAGLAIAAIAATACHRREPTARERVLAGLPADAVAIVAADGRALSHPRFRAMLDAAAERWPASSTLPSRARRSLRAWTGPATSPWSLRCRARRAARR